MALNCCAVATSGSSSFIGRSLVLGVRQFSCSSASLCPPPKRPNLKRKPVDPDYLGLANAKLVDGKSHLDEEWTDLWPVPRSYDHNLVHLPIRAGHPLVRGEPNQDSISNQELLKISNFFHLTPPHIEKHIEALRPLCTKWPEDISTESHPVTVTTSNYLQPGVSTLHALSHEVTLTVRATAVPLFMKKREKLIALAGKHFDQETDVITLESESLPTRKLNKDHVNYQLLALYLELKKVEDWEEETQLAVHNL